MGEITSTSTATEFVRLHEGKIAERAELASAKTETIRQNLPQRKFIAIDENFVYWGGGSTDSGAAEQWLSGRDTEQWVTIGQGNLVDLAAKQKMVCAPAADNIPCSPAQLDKISRISINSCPITRPPGLGGFSKAVLDGGWVYFIWGTGCDVSQPFVGRARALEESLPPAQRYEVLQLRERGPTALGLDDRCLFWAEPAVSSGKISIWAGPKPR